MSDFRRHYLYKLLTNFVRIPVSFVLQALFPRLLGPASYGNFDFLVDSANKFIAFFESGTSIAFYTKLSQRNTDKILIKFYWFLNFAIVGFYLLFISATWATNTIGVIWPDQEIRFVLLSALWGIVTLFSNTVSKIMDACNLTVKAEKLRMLQLVVSVAIFSAVYWLQTTIDLTNFFYLQILLVIVLVSGSALMLQRAGYSIFPDIKLGISDIKKYAEEFWIFSSPLLLYSIVGLVAGIGDRWLLQLFGGSIEQAFFGISYRVGAFVFLFTSAMMPLLMREYSKMFADNNMAMIRSGFIQNFKLLYFLAAFLAIFVAFNSRFVVQILAGSEFVNAQDVVMLMAFYPIHQTLGQLNGTIYYSTSRTRQYRNIGLSVLPFGLIFSFILIAPKSMWGYDLGAIGLAIQMLVIQFLTVNVMLYYNCEFLKIKFGALLAYQIAILVAGCIIAYMIHTIISTFKFDFVILSPALFFSTFLLVVGGLLFVQPMWVGVPRTQLNSLLNIVKKR